MEKLESIRDNMIKSVFQNNLSDLQEEIDTIKSSGSSLDNICVQINWDDNELNGKTKEEKDTIIKIRKFIQNLYNEYQIRATSILAKKTKEYENKEFKDNEEKNATLIQDMQNDAAILLIEMFIKCINYCNKEEHQNAFNYYKQDLEQIENLYISIKKKNKELENENADLKQEIETMKQKKFMGLFKIFK